MGIKNELYLDNPALINFYYDYFQLLIGGFQQLDIKL